MGNVVTGGMRWEYVCEKPEEDQYVFGCKKAEIGNVLRKDDAGKLS